MDIWSIYLIKIGGGGLSKIGGILNFPDIFNGGVKYPDIFKGGIKFICHICTCVRKEYGL